MKELPDSYRPCDLDLNTIYYNEPPDKSGVFDSQSVYIYRPDEFIYYMYVVTLYKRDYVYLADELISQHWRRITDEEIVKFIKITYFAEIVMKDVL